MHSSHARVAMDVSLFYNQPHHAQLPVVRDSCTLKSPLSKSCVCARYASKQNETLLYHYYYPTIYHHYYYCLRAASRPKGGKSIGNEWESIADVVVACALK